VSIRIVTRGDMLSVMWVGMGPHAVLSEKPVVMALTDLPAWVPQSLAILMSLPTPPPSQPEVPGIGSRHSDDTFWLDDKGGWL
jgi:hypothetical protein